MIFICNVISNAIERVFPLMKKLDEKQPLRRHVPPKNWRNMFTTSFRMDEKDQFDCPAKEHIGLVPTSTLIIFTQSEKKTKGDHKSFVLSIINKSLSNILHILR